jgi:ferredoxin
MRGESAVSTLGSSVLRSEAGNVQVAVAAAGFTTVFFLFFSVLVILVLRSGWLTDRSRRSPDYPEPQARQGRPGRPIHPEQQLLGQQPLLGQSQFPAQPQYPGERPSRPEPERPPEPPPTRGERLKGKKFGTSRIRGKIVVEVNPNKCARFGFCEHEAPDVFYLQSDGRFGYQGTVPVERLEEVVQAMDVCPRRAISLKIPKGADAPKVPMRVEPEGTWRTLPTIVPHPAEDGERRPPRRSQP